MNACSQRRRLFVIAASRLPSSHAAGPQPPTRRTIWTRLAAIIAFLFAYGPAAIAFSHSAYAREHRIGFLSVASPATMSTRVRQFQLGLREHGYVEGRNIVIEYRWAEGHNERLEDLARELIRFNVELLIVHGAAATSAAKKLTGSLPIVCFACGDMVSTGLVTSLARPEANVTGQTIMSPDAAGKRMELLREFVPGLVHVAALWNATNPVSGPELAETRAAAGVLGLTLHSMPVRHPGEFEQAFSAMRSAGAQAVIVLSDAMFFGERGHIAGLAVKHRLPAVSWTAEFARSGGLMSYGPDVAVMARRAAVFVDRILKGAQPADLPIEQPIEFELAVNHGTAQKLGLSVPGSVLARADEVIE